MNTSRIFGALLSVLSLGCQDEQLPKRKIVVLEDGRNLDLLRQEVEGDTLYVDYVTEVSLNDPEAVREDAAEILRSYAADEADANGCPEIVLGATDWLENGDARSLLITAIRDDDGDWRLR